MGREKRVGKCPTVDTERGGGQVMTILIGKCMNCGKVYGNKVAGTLESIYNLEITHKCEGEGK